MGIDDDETDRDLAASLVRSLSFALAHRTGLFRRGIRIEHGDDVYSGPARQIVKHLRQSNWRFMRGPPEDSTIRHGGHRTPAPATIDPVSSAALSDSIEQRSLGEDFVCGQYSQAKRLQLWAMLMGATLPDDWRDRLRYRIAPTTLAPVVRLNPEGQRQIDYLRWGLIPVWSKDDRGGSRMINARSETVDVKPAYRSAFKKRRCLVLADGWYEWVEGNDGKKKPFRFVEAEERPFAIAGLWEGWKRPDDTWLHTFSMVTCTNQDEHGHIHDRAPVTLTEEAHWRDWLDPAMPAADLKAMCFAHGRFRAYRVGTGVSYVRTPDGPHLIEPAEELD